MNIIVNIGMLVSNIIGAYIVTLITGSNLITENNYNDFNGTYVIATPICTIFTLIYFETIMLIRTLRKEYYRKIYYLMIAVTLYQFLLLAAFCTSIKKPDYINALSGVVISLFIMLVDYLIHRYSLSIIENESVTGRLNEQEELYKKEYALIKEKEKEINKLRAHRHDYMNQLSVISHMIESEEPENETSAFIDQIIDSIKG